jgi:hypothetical protein
LEAFLTHICVFEDLAADRGQQEGRREGPYTCFKLYFDVFRTIRMGSPQGRHIEIQHQDFYFSIEIEGDSGLQFTNSSLMPTLEFLEIAT